MNRRTPIAIVTDGIRKGEYTTAKSDPQSRLTHARHGRPQSADYSLRTNDRRPIFNIRREITLVW
jgi:hypothetical protein